MSSTMMNIEALIELVRNKPQLWDRCNKYHGNRKVLDKCWSEIAADMKHDEVKIRKKWKYLRDQFSVEFGRIPPADCEDEVLAYEPKWRYYKALQFLEEVVTPRVSTRNPKKDCDTSDGSQNTSAPGSPSSVDNTLNNGSRYSKRKLDVKKNKLRYLRDKHKQKRPDSVHEEHLHFFKSLLPHVRNIPTHLQLSFRNRVQEIVEEFAYRSDSASIGDPEKTGGFTVNEPYFITCVPDHAAKSEPTESADDTQDQDHLILGVS